MIPAHALLEVVEHPEYTTALFIACEKRRLSFRLRCWQAIQELPRCRPLRAFAHQRCEGFAESGLILRLVEHPVVGYDLVPSARGELQKFTRRLSIQAEANQLLEPRQNLVHYPIGFHFSSPPTPELPCRFC